MSDVQVIGLPQSNFVWAVRIALAEKGVEHEVAPVWSHSPEAQALHPFGKIPGFRHGDIEMCESRAIIDYVDAVFDGPRLVPTELKARIRSGVWTSIVSTSIEPLFIRQYLFAHMFPDKPDKQPDRAVIEALVPKVDAALDVLEAAVEAGEIGSDGFGRTDAYLVPILFYLRTTPGGGSMLAAHPNLTGYLERALTRPSVKATMALRRQPVHECAARRRECPFTGGEPRAAIGANLPGEGSLTTL